MALKAKIFLQCPVLLKTPSGIIFTSSLCLLLVLRSLAIISVWFMVLPVRILRLLPFYCFLSNTDEIDVTFCERGHPNSCIFGWKLLRSCILQVDSGFGHSRQLPKICGYMGMNGRPLIDVAICGAFWLFLGNRVLFSHGLHGFLVLYVVFHFL